jgi:hypothetical protein
MNIFWPALPDLLLQKIGISLLTLKKTSPVYMDVDFSVSV